MTYHHFRFLILHLWDVVQSDQEIYDRYERPIQKKSELPGRSFCISLPLADKERLSEEFVVVT